MASKRVARAALLLISLALCAAIDYATGIEVSVFLLYTVPVVLCTYFFGAYPGVGMALLSTVVWMTIDRLSGHQYSQIWIWYVNAFNRSACFVLAVAATRHLAHWRSTTQRQLRAFQGPIPVCTQCQRVSDKTGYWWGIDGYLTEFGGATPQPKVCPDCSRHAYAQGDAQTLAQQDD